MSRYLILPGTSARVDFVGYLRALALSRLKQSVRLGVAVVSRVRLTGCLTSQLHAKCNIGVDLFTQLWDLPFWIEAAGLPWYLTDSHIILTLSQPVLWIWQHQTLDKQNVRTPGVRQPFEYQFSVPGISDMTSSKRWEVTIKEWTGLEWNILLWKPRTARSGGSWL